jgi:hypothetical protein
MVVRTKNVFFERIQIFLNKEIHIKLEQDEDPVLYTLREVGEDFLVVDYGESQRIIHINKIIFIQIGNYPKE